MSSILVNPQLVRKVAERESKRLNPERLKYLIGVLEPRPLASRKWLLEAYEKAFFAALDAIKHTMATKDFKRLWQIEDEIETYLGHEFALIAALFMADMAERLGVWYIVEGITTLMPVRMKAIRDLRAKEENWSLIRALEEANLRFSRDGMVEYIFEGARLGRVVEEKIKGNPLVDTKLTIQLPGIYTTLMLNERAMKDAVRRDDVRELWRLGAELGRQIVDAAWLRGGSVSKIEERAYALAIVADYHMVLKDISRAYEGMWRGVAEEIYMTLLGAS